MKAKKKILSAGFCGENRIAVIGEDDDLVTVGYAENPSDEIRGRLERYFMPERRVEFVRIEKDELEVRLERLYSGEGSEGVSDDRKGEEKEDEESSAKAAPAVNLLRSILTEGIMKGASDIHIDIRKDKAEVRYRKDGRLCVMLEAEKEKGGAVISRIKHLSAMNILEHRRCQDGRFEYKRNGSEWDIRVSVIPGMEGESVVLRLLGGDVKAPELEKLGFTKVQLEAVKKMIKTQSGLVLAAGPTGSGKTTTLASIITRLNRGDINIITVEDPVEYRIEGILQVGVDEGIGKTFPEVLKRVLRHDPDILMVGEIRDEQTASMACRLALTGHLVLASIHTSGCKETPVRLTDMGVPSYVVSAVLKGVISQRLVQKKGGGRTLKAEVMCFENADEVRALCGK